MTQQLPTIEAAILIGAVVDLRNVLAAGAPAGYGFGIEKIRHQAATHGLVRPDPGRWLRCSVGEDAASRMRLSRAYKALERRGLVERVCMGFVGNHITHIKPTDAGIALAKQLTTPAEPATTQKETR